MRLQKRLWLGLLSLLGMLSCVTTEDFERYKEEQERRINEMKQRVDDVQLQAREAWTTILCPPEERELFDKAQKECPDACETTHIYGALSNIGGIQFLINSHPRHEAFYLQKKAPPLLLNDLRADKLRRLAHLPLLSTTRFVVIALTSPFEPHPALAASQRGELVTMKLRELLMAGDGTHPGLTADQIQKERRIWRWYYDKPIAKNQIKRLDDQPKVNLGEDDNLSHVVMVFRVDC